MLVFNLQKWYADFNGNMEKLIFSLTRVPEDPFSEEHFKFGSDILTTSVKVMDLLKEVPADKTDLQPLTLESVMYQNFVTRVAREYRDDPSLSSDKRAAMKAARELSTLLFLLTRVVNDSIDHGSTHFPDYSPPPEMGMFERL